jgi:AraC-like DNA-binding protein
MDIHRVPGIEALDAAEAHRKDLLIQKEYQCKCMTYWIDESRGVAFCLIEGPDKATVEEMHRRSHGLIPNKIIEVKNELVDSFLGRISDPEDAQVLDNGLKVFSDSAYRTLIVADHTDPVLLRHRLGTEGANNLLENLNKAIRNQITVQGGREVEHTGSGLIASFSSAARAITCAQKILQDHGTTERHQAGLRMAVNAGEPVEKSNNLFGDVVNLGRYLCSIHSQNRIVVANRVRELLGHDFLKLDQDAFLTLLPQHETFLESLFGILDENWQDPGFDVTEFCQTLSMSKSQLYRKTVSLWGMSPNNLLREFRLDKARELLRKQSNNIAQTTFDSGFNSPSYFTKCFKKKFGVLPAHYLNASA